MDKLYLESMENYLKSLQNEKDYIERTKEDTVLEISHLQRKLDLDKEALIINNQRIKATRKEITKIKIEK